MAVTGSGPIPDLASPDEASAIKGLRYMKEYFDAQKKVKIKIPKDRGEQFVQVNGYTFNIAAGFEVAVPEQIAHMLRDAEII